MSFRESTTVCTVCRPNTGGLSPAPCPGDAGTSACPALIVLARLAAAQEVLP